MSWHAHLSLNYRRDAERTLVHDRHTGPLRVLASLYPEGPAICHNVLVHPPGGIVGGDVLELELTLGEQSHALLTTPGATRFYRPRAAGMAAAADHLPPRRAGAKQPAFRAGARRRDDGLGHAGAGPAGQR
jgi:urease accessory protein UreH